MNINNCFEAVMEMGNLSAKLGELYEKNAKAEGKFDGGINSTEHEFLAIKHSLDVIQVPNYDKSAYGLALELVEYEKAGNTNEKYLELKEVLTNTTYAKNLKYYL